MTPRERVLAAINGEKPDRVPFCFWYHFNPDPAAGPDSKMAQLELDFFNRYKPDILKVMHDIDFEPIPKIESIDDWAKLERLDPHAGNFGKQLHTLGAIRAELDPDVPMLATVFGVYHYAELLSEGRLLTHLRADASAVHKGLSALADSLATYAATTVAEGSDGIYYALLGASAAGASRQEYNEQFLGYDRLILHAVDNASMNVLHLHGYNDLYFDLVHSLPASAVCWSDIAGGPSIQEARKIHKGCLMAGIDETQFVNLTRDQIITQGREAIAAAGDSRFILGPGCSIPTDSDPELIEAFRLAVE
ncbi:MAG: uroporphyrinogen decarboxylase family protein [Capsulimonadaceae bacterium]|nr:uroporphyrinogen decarboxylase family protein [Capsulimonadaceae bacterium]